MPLTEALRTRTSGVPNPFPPELFTVDAAHKISGDRARFIRLKGNRQAAKLAKYGSPSVRRQLQDIGDADIRMMHSHEEFQLDPAVMIQLQSFEQYTQDKGMEWMSYQIEEAAHRAQTTRIASTATVLSVGNIYWNSQGDLLPSSSGAAETYSFNIPGTHQNQLNGIIAASWALHTTDIPGQLRTLKQAAAEDTGMEPKVALYGINVPKYMTQNDYVQAYLSRNPSLNDKFMSSGEIPDGLFGFKWVPVYTSFYEDASGTNQLLWGSDLVTFMPDFSQEAKMAWWGMWEGSIFIPRSIEIQKNPKGGLTDVEECFGQFMYAYATINPVGYTIVHGDTFLPALRNEDALWQATVAF